MLLTSYLLSALFTVCSAPTALQPSSASRTLQYHWFAGDWWKSRGRGWWRRGGLAWGLEQTSFRLLHCKAATTQRWAWTCPCCWLELVTVCFCTAYHSTLISAIEICVLVLLNCSYVCSCSFILLGRFMWALPSYFKNLFPQLGLLLLGQPCFWALT